MRVLVTGATGLIGSAVCARLLSEGHEVTAAVRPGSRPLPVGIAATVEIDMAATANVESWARHLVGMDAVVNCAGVFQDSAHDNTEAVHSTGAALLFRACEKQGVRRVIHFSAIGVDREQPSAFSATKLKGDSQLMQRDLDWVILRPSVVLGHAVFGASAMFRGLAALPFQLCMRNAGRLQVVVLDDVTATVAFFLRPSAPSKVALDLAGPERLHMDEVVARYRAWLGWPPAPAVTLPEPVARLSFRAGDFAGLFGWRPPMRSTARKEIQRGAIGNAEPWRRMTGIEPASLGGFLAREPVSVQERWFAKLYFLKPVIFIVLAAFWIGTGIVSLTVGYGEGTELMLRVGAGALSGPGVIAGAIADIVVGAAIAFRRTARRGLYGAIALSLFYALAGTFLLPELWTEPLGPLMKIWPILVLHLVALAILQER